MSMLSLDSKMAAARKQSMRMAQKACWLQDGHHISCYDALCPLCPLIWKEFLSYNHTLSIPSSIVATGVKSWKGNLQATTWPPSFNSFANFSLRGSICKKTENTTPPLIIWHPNKLEWISYKQKESNMNSFSVPSNKLYYTAQLRNKAHTAARLEYKSC